MEDKSREKIPKRNIQKMPYNAGMEFRIPLNFQVVTDMKGNKKHFCKYIAVKKKIGELSGNQLTNNLEKLTEVINVLFNYIFTGKVCQGIRLLY